MTQKMLTAAVSRRLTVCEPWLACSICACPRTALSSSITFT